MIFFVLSCIYFNDDLLIFSSCLSFFNGMLILTLSIFFFSVSLVFCFIFLSPIWRGGVWGEGRWCVSIPAVKGQVLGSTWKDKDRLVAIIFHNLYTKQNYITRHIRLVECMTSPKKSYDDKTVSTMVLLRSAVFIRTYEIRSSFTLHYCNVAGKLSAL